MHIREAKLGRWEQDWKREDRPGQIFTAFIYQRLKVKLKTFTAHLLQAELTYELLKQQHIEKGEKFRFKSDAMT